MKKNAGFTMIELLLAVGLSTLVVGATTYLIYQFFSEHRSLEVWSSGQFEMSSSLRDLEGDIRNIVRLDPIEQGADKYLGLRQVAAGLEPSVCLNDASSPVFRYTSLDRRRHSETLLRAWSEEANSGKKNGADELRITYDGTADTLFNSERAPREIVLVDADRRYLRRYVVDGFIPRMNTNLDPYDDAPKVDTYGQPIYFSYVSVYLKNPPGIRGEEVTKASSVFITGSEAYAANTYFVCLRKKDRALIKYDQVAQQEKVLLHNPMEEFEIDALRVGYLGTRPNVRVEPESFLFAVTDELTECMNTVFLELKLKANSRFADRNKGQMIGDLKSDILRRRTVFSPNLNMKRPISCQN